MLERYARGDRTARDLLALAYEAGVKDAGQVLTTSKLPTQTREAEGLDRLFSIEPNVGATTNEPSLHTILLGYYLPHFEYDEAKRLADAYVAALNARGGA